MARSLRSDADGVARSASPIGRSLNKRPAQRFAELLLRLRASLEAARYHACASRGPRSAPPLLCRGGECPPPISHRNYEDRYLGGEITNSQQPPAEQFDPARFLSAACTSHLQLNCKPSFERCSSRS